MLILGFIIDIARNVFSFAWRVGVGYIVQIFMYWWLDRMGLGSGLFGRYGTGVCFLDVCIAGGIVWWTFTGGWGLYDDYGVCGVIRCVLLSLVTILCVAVVPIMVVAGY